MSLVVVPWEIILEISYYLSISDILSFTATSTRYRELRRDLSFWRHYSVTHFKFPANRFTKVPFSIEPLHRIQQIRQWDRFIHIPPFRFLDLLYPPMIYMISENSKILQDLDEDNHPLYDHLFSRLLLPSKITLIPDLYYHQYMEGTHYLLGCLAVNFLENNEYYLFGHVRLGNGSGYDGDGFWKYYLCANYRILKDYILSTLRLNLSLP